MLPVLLTSTLSTVSAIADTQWFNRRLNPADEAHDIELNWRVKNQHYEFEVNVTNLDPTWFGLGLSSSGSMIGAEIQVFLANTEKISTYYATGMTWPTPYNGDTEPAELMGFTHDASRFIYKYKRPVASLFDRALDLDFNDMALYVIYAYKTSGGFGYHGSQRRGSKLLYLSDPKPDHVLPEFDSSVTGTKLPQGNPNGGGYELTSDRTQYTCKFFETPAKQGLTTEKIHIVATELELPVENSHVHHLILYVCDPGVTELPAELNLDEARDCDYVRTFEVAENCIALNYAWAIGGETVYVLGDDMGVTLHPETQYFMTETHYDNPGNLDDIVDHTNFTIYWTEDIRPESEATLMIGPWYKKMSIPHGHSPYYFETYLGPECTERLPHEIYVSGLSAHMHNAGVGATLKVIRDGEVVHQFDFIFDFNVQNFHEVDFTVQPGDAFDMVCEYDTSGMTEPLLGGDSSDEEMCYFFLRYTPAIDDVYWSSAMLVMNEVYKPEQMVTEGEGNTYGFFQTFGTQVNRCDVPKSDGTRTSEQVAALDGTTLNQTMINEITEYFEGVWGGEVTSTVLPHDIALAAEQTAEWTSWPRPEEPAPAPGNGEDDGDNKALIYGLTIGGAVLLLIALVVLAHMMCPKSKLADDKPAGETTSTAVAANTPTMTV